MWFDDVWWDVLMTWWYVVRCKAELDQRGLGIFALGHWWSWWWPSDRRGANRKVSNWRDERWLHNDGPIFQADQKSCTRHFNGIRNVQDLAQLAWPQSCLWPAAVTHSISISGKDSHNLATGCPFFCSSPLWLIYQAILQLCRSTLTPVLSVSWSCVGALRPRPWRWCSHAEPIMVSRHCLPIAEPPDNLGPLDLNTGLLNYWQYWMKTKHIKTIQN